MSLPMLEKFLTLFTNNWFYTNRVELREEIELDAVIE